MRKNRPTMMNYNEIQHDKRNTDRRVYFSSIDDPEDYPSAAYINVGHPAIARFLAKCINKFLRFWKWMGE